MAIGLMNRIWWRDDLNPSEKMVLLCLADRADDDGVCWYAVETICRKSSLSRRGVQTVIARLVSRGLLRKVARHDRSNYYVIPIAQFPEIIDAPRPAKEKGSLSYLEEEPDLFMERGARAAPRGGAPNAARGASAAKRGASAAPDSLNDSLNDPPNAHTREEGLTIEELIVLRWDALADEHAPLASFQGVLSAERKSKIDARTKEGMKLVPSLETAAALWEYVFDIIGRSKLLTGQKTAWAPTLDWILGPKNFTKIMEGNYGHGHDRIGAPTNEPRDRSAVAAGRAARDIVERAKQRTPGQGPGRHSGRAAGAHQ